MMDVASKKGFFSLFWVAIIMVVTTAIMVVATNMFSDFVALPNSLLTAPFQGYYNAEFGMWHGKAVLDSGATTMGSISYPIPAGTYRNTVDLIVTISRITGSNNYLITSTENPPAGSRPPVTMRARWNGTLGVIDQIR